MKNRLARPKGRLMAMVVAAALVFAAVLIARALTFNTPETKQASLSTRVPIPTTVPTSRPPTPTPIPSDLSLRFSALGWPYYQMVSLNEESVTSLMHLDLAQYQFPRDYALSVRDDAVYLTVTLRGEAVHIRTMINRDALSPNCAPSPDLRRLLCALYNMNHIDRAALTADFVTPTRIKQVEDAANAYLDGNLRKDYFIITRGEPEIQLLPAKAGLNQNYTFRTTCSWISADEILCQNGSPWNASQSVVYDLRQNSFVELPNDGRNLMTIGSAGNFFLGYERQGSGVELRVYSKLSKVLYEAVGLFQAFPTQDSVVFTEACDNSQLCFHYLKIDADKVERDVKIELGGGVGKDGSPCFRNISTAAEYYLVTACDRVYFVGKDTLRVGQILNLPQSAPYQPRYALYSYQQLLVVVDQALRTYRDRLYSYGKATVYNLELCRGTLDDSCAVHDWAVAPQGTPGSSSESPQRLYYFWLNDPNRLFVTDAQTRTLRTIRLDNMSESVVDLGYAPDLMGISLDKEYILISERKVGPVTAEERTYHLIDLTTGAEVPLKLVPGGNLIFIRYGI